MNKSIVKISAVVLLVSTFMGCGDKTPEPVEVPNFGCKQEGVLAPKWTCLPRIEGAYAGVGIAQKSAAGMSHMRKVAMMNGRSDLAQQIQTQVKDRMKGFTQTTGSGDRETVDQVTQAVTDQISNVSLNGSKAIDIWTAPSGSLYVLMTVPEDFINEQVKNSVKTSLKNDEALWQQFQASKAFDSLDAALEK